MNFTPYERDNVTTAVGSLEPILWDGHQAATELSTVMIVGNIHIASHSLEAALHKVAARIARANGEDTFDGLADWPVSKNRRASRNRSTKLCSSARLLETVLDRLWVLWPWWKMQF